MEEDQFDETAVPVNFGDDDNVNERSGGRKKRYQDNEAAVSFGGGLKSSVLWGATTTQPITEEEASVHYALMDADAKLDSNMSQLKGSRRLFYRGDSADDSEEFYSTRDSFRSVMSQRRSSGKQGDGGDRFYAVSSEFLSSQANLDVMQRDLAEAEALFFQKYAESEPPRTTFADSSLPHFKIQLFNPRFYDNIEHVWENKAFVVEHMLTFFGTIKEDRMDKVVKNTRARIFEHGEDCWDKEGLVLADVGRLFGCKLLLSVNNAKKLQEADNKNIKIEYLSGVWLSKVYQGEYELFSNWVEDTLAYVKRKYGRVVSAHQNWFAFYPSALEKQKPAGECLVVFFTRISESVDEHKQASKEFQSVKLEI